MVAVIDNAALAAHLNVDAATLEADSRAVQILELTNGLINEKWTNPPAEGQPVPTSVKILGLDIAARAYTSTPGKGPVESITRSFDDSSRTERFAVPAQARAGGLGVFITAEELEKLNPPLIRRKVGSIGLGVPGYPRSPGSLG